MLLLQKYGITVCKSNKVNIRFIREVIQFGKKLRKGKYKTWKQIKN